MRDGRAVCAPNLRAPEPEGLTIESVGIEERKCAASRE